jgi:hypothetical protein
MCGRGDSRASMEGAEDCVISSEVKGTSLHIVNWSTLWSQVPKGLALARARILVFPPPLPLKHLHANV